MEEQRTSSEQLCQIVAAAAAVAARGPEAAGPAQSRSDGGGHAQPHSRDAAQPPRLSSGSGRCLPWNALHPARYTGTDVGATVAGTLACTSKIHQL